MNTERFLDISNEEYHADTTRISKSKLDLINKSPAHYYYETFEPDKLIEKENEIFTFGSAFHCIVLEPDEFDKRYLAMPKIDRRTKEGKASYEEFLQLAQGKQLISETDYEILNRMRDNAYRHLAAKALLNLKGLCEKVIHFDEPYYNIKCKIRMDKAPQDANIIIDLKTTEDASPDGFARSAYNFRYDVQGAFYSDGWQYSGLPKLDNFIFIAIEKKPPFNVGVYYASNEMLRLGSNRYMTNLATYKECRDKNVWPGYSEKIEPLYLPNYALKSINK